MDSATILKRLLRLRGIKNQGAFFKPDYHSLNDPLKLPDIKIALKTIDNAIKKRHKIAIYGDYDIDGLCATTILHEIFSRSGNEPICFIPDRFSEGYGLNEDSITKLAKAGVELIITVDCGSRSEKEIQLAKKLGLTVIVTDHHDIDEPPKSAAAVINPKRSDSKYPFSYLSGAGVAFTLVRALQKEKIIDLIAGQEKWLLDLVALSTVCDVVDLVDENRVLVKFGFKVIDNTRRPGLKALLRVAQVESIDEVALGYRIGPRLNAAGRLEHASKALKLLQTTDIEEAQGLALMLDDLNLQRREQQDRILQAALIEAEKYHDQSVLVLTNKDWSHGINGIVAAKINEQLNKPTFVMQELGDGTTKGSARSSGQFDLSAAIKSVQDLLISGGGHRYAAGATVLTKHVDDFRQRLNKYFLANFEPETNDQFSLADIVTNDFNGISLELASQIEAMKPFGQGNPEPLFCFEAVHVSSQRAVGADAKHVKLTLQDKAGNTLEAIAFNQAVVFEKIAPETEATILAALQVNRYNHQLEPQLMVRAVR